VLFRSAPAIRAVSPHRLHAVVPVRPLAVDLTSQKEESVVKYICR